MEFHNRKKWGGGWGLFIITIVTMSHIIIVIGTNDHLPKSRSDLE